MNDLLMKRLQGEILETHWEDLREHYEAGRVVMITTDLDLVDVAADMVIDDTDVIKAWLTQKKLYRPTPQQIEEIEEHPEYRFRFLIVRPYVLVQAVA